MTKKDYWVVYLKGDNEKIIGNLISVIKEELNIKEVIFKKDMNAYLEYIVKPNFQLLGKKLGSKIKLLQNELLKLSNDDINKIINDKLIIKLDNEDFILDKDNTIITIKQKEGYASVADNNTIVVLDTELNEDLILEGLAREFVRNVQALRKEKDLVITDHINISYNGSDSIDKMLKVHKDYIMQEVLG